jgi:acetyl-CoA carboxylase carboxyl transferase subunit beta
MPMSVPEWLSNRRNGARTQDIAVWSKCPNCGEVVYRRDLAANAFVCPRCKYHFRMTAFDRIDSLIDGEFVEIGADIAPGDPLEWTDKRSYPDKLSADREKSGLSEAVVCGFGQIGEFDVGLGVMDFHFRGGTMGSVVGERIALLLEESLRRDVPCIIFTASGGARMEEGMLALTQLAKTTAAVARFAQGSKPFVTVLTDPTTGGVSASFAFQSDVVIAESRAVIGFAGRRVIEQTIRQKLPDQFQTAEFLLEKGAIDMVVERQNVKSTLTRLLEYTTPVAR